MKTEVLIVSYSIILGMFLLVFVVFDHGLQISFSFYMLEFQPFAFCKSLNRFMVDYCQIPAVTQVTSNKY